jgi:hypothetical protein
VCITAACLAYLTLWWRVVGMSARNSLAATTLALVVAVVVALLLGHTATVVAMAVFARRDGREELPQLTLPSWRARAALLAITLMASATLYALAPRTMSGDRTAPRLVVVSNGLRLQVIGVDGFDPRFARDVAARRSLPTLRALLDRRAVELPRQPGWDPVAVWMSIATGQPPQRHGAWSLESRRVAGLSGRVPQTPGRLGALVAATTDLLRLTEPGVSSGTERREKTFWELAATAGLRTAAVNWWTTWPASPLEGVVITDRASLRLDRGGPLEAEVAPPALYDRLVAAWPAMRMEVANEVARVSGGLQAPASNVVARAAEVDASQIAFARALELKAYDLVTVYLPALDIAHTALFGEGRAPSASTVAQRLEGIERLYAQLDAALATLRAADPESVLVLITYPGRVGDDVPGLMIVATAGPAPAMAAARTDVTPPRLEDAAATILRLLGLPLSRDLAGRVRGELLPANLLARNPERFVERYPSRQPAADLRAPATRDVLDAEARERLRSLGYVH